MDITGMNVPQIVTMPRNECVLSFAGSTDYAYPMMMLIYYAINEYRKIRMRAMDILDLNGYIQQHCVKVFIIKRQKTCA